MKKLIEIVSRPSGFDSLSNYCGQTEFGDFHSLLTQNRDSDCLIRSNFRSALKELGGESENVVIHRFGHWSCGWWESLAVKSSTPEFAIAEKIESRLADYPVVDEDDFSELETNEANEVWRDCYRPKERVAYIRKHQSQFEFHGLADLLACVRGKFFAGYASELLN